MRIIISLALVLSLSGCYEIASLAIGYIPLPEAKADPPKVTPP